LSLSSTEDERGEKKSIIKNLFGGYRNLRFLLGGEKTSTLENLLLAELKPKLTVRLSAGGKNKQGLFKK